MPEFKIVLDRSKPFSENRGDVTPEDPHYRVRFWQGQMVKKAMVLLPFDAHDELVPDDGKTEPWQQHLPNGPNGAMVMVTHFPLYNQAMRDLLALKTKRGAEIASKSEDEAEDEAPLDTASAAEEINFALWLRGQVKYDNWQLLQAAGKKRYSRMWTSKRQMVEDLVLDHNVVPEADVCPALAKHLSAKAA